MTVAGDIVMLITSLTIVTIVYKYYQTVVYHDKDPNFLWNRIFLGKIESYPQTTESQQWAFFFLSTVNLLVCCLVVTTFLVCLSWVKEVADN